MASRDRTVDRIADLAGRGLDLVSFWTECTEVIGRAVPHMLAPCWFTFDPATALITSHHQEGIPEIPGEWLADEYYSDDFNKMADVVRSERGASTLAEATGGDPWRSARYREQMVPFGAEQELLVGLRGRRGDVWGCLGLYRAPGQPEFDANEIDLLRTASPYLAEGASRALLVAEAEEPDGPDSPGLVILDQQWDVESMTPATPHWLDDMPDGDWKRGRLPSAVLAVAGQARSEGGEDGFVRIRTRSGGWVVLHGAPLPDGDRVAVIIEAAHPGRIAPLLMAAYQLTQREREVTTLVLQGESTAEIAIALSISDATVQQHLKRIFEKTGVRSRRDLTGKVFFSNYEPRVRDNECRAVMGASLRGGPVAVPQPANASLGSGGRRTSS